MARSVAQVVMLTSVGAFAAAGGDFCGDPDAGLCCCEQETPYCDDLECCETVCAVDPFCCEVQWDQICVDEALQMCDGITCPTGCGPLPCCGNPRAGSCCAADDTPCCDNVRCCVTVCSVDPFCCETAWDQICVDEAHSFCGDACGGCCHQPGAGSCFDPHETPCCFDPPGCCDLVCAIDPFCCDILWDFICAGEAADFCELPPPPANDRCDSAAPIILPPGGSTSVASTSVNADHDGAPACPGGLPQVGPGVWYRVIGNGHTITAHTCAATTFDTMLTVFCGSCPKPLASNCCTVTGVPGCDEPECQATVCAVDPFCCDILWDFICADEASRLCGELCSIGGGALCIAGNDDFCGLQSQVSWCARAGAEYLILVHAFGEVAGSFTLTLSDNDVDCTPAVDCPLASCFQIVSDSTECIGAGGDFNYQVVGTNTCTDSAMTFDFVASGGDPGEPMCFAISLFDNNGDPCCNATVCTTVPDCTPSSEPCDLDGDQVIGVADMLILLGAWGSDSGGPPDYDGDGTVDITDFLHLLAAWGPC